MSAVLERLSVINLSPICYKYKLLSIWGLVNEILYVNVEERSRYELIADWKRSLDFDV